MSDRGDIQFEVTDPRGRTVICNKSCWNRHILAKRPWMDEWESQVIVAISNPDPRMIFQNPDFSNRQVYYRRQPHKGRYVKVVVEFLKDGTGRVRTAHPADSMKKGEEWIWPQSND